MRNYQLKIKVKIFFIIKNLSNAVGGAERVFCKISSLLDDKGHDITVITFDKDNNLNFYDIKKSIKRINLSIGNSSSKTNLSEYFRRIFALRNLLSITKPDLVIGFMHSAYIPISFALLGKSVPLIASEHTAINHYFKRPIQFLLLLISSFLINRFTVLSLFIKSKYPYIISRKMVVIPNPVMAVNSLNKNDNIPKRNIILSVGRLEEEKDHLTLIQSFAKIVKSHQDWDLHIIGEGKLKNKLHEKINSLGLIDRIYIKGFTKDIDSKYREAKIFALPSKYEAFGLVTAEAMSYGIPCIGFADCPGTNELIINDETGLLVKSSGNRSSSLAEGIERLISDEQYRICLGRAAREAIKKNFADEEVAEAWEHLLYNVVKRNC